MRRVLLTVGLAALMAAFVAAQAAKVCAGVKEKRDYCSKCDALLKKDEVKGGKCVKDETAVVKVDVCVKSSYIPTCHPAKASAKPTSWWGKEFKEPTVSEAGVFFSCATCGAKARISKDLKHKDDCKKKAVGPAVCEH